MNQRFTLLINPPLWNAYAPHLAVPLLAGTLRDQGLPVRCHDASVEVLDWLLSADGLRALAAREAGSRDRHVAARGRLVHDHTVRAVDRAKTIIRDLSALSDAQGQAWARRVTRNAMWSVSAAFDGLRFDLVANDLYYSATSTKAVLGAVDDPERNVYRWALDRLVPRRFLDDPALGVVGISMSADTQLIAAMTAAAEIRRRRPDVRIVVGGNYATRMVEEWSAPHPFFDWVDAFVMAEGEEALPELVRRWNTGRDVSDVPGVVTASGGTLVKRPARPVPLDGVSAPYFADLPLDRYFAPGPILPVYASRSCAWSCAFCSIPFASNSFRSRPAAQTVDHLEHLMAEYGTRTFMFVDEILTLHVLREVAREIVDRGLELHWYGETRFAGGFSRELADLLYRSGCRRLNFGLESYNQRVLDLMAKGTKVEHIDRTLRNVVAAGIAPHLFVIHGFPGETLQEAEHTVSYAEEKIREARTTYGNPYATWGGSPFILDLHSPIAKDPGRFGIELVESPADEDLSLVREYTVAQGLTSAQAMDVAQTARRSTVIRRNVWFRTRTESALAEVEEFTFLRACLGAPNAEALRSSPASVDAADDRRVRLSCTAYVLPWQAGESGGAALALYQGDSDRFVQLSWPSGETEEILARGTTVAELARWFGAHEVTWGGTGGRALVELLIRHGMLGAVDGGSLLREARQPAEWCWSREPAVLDAAHDDGAVLHSPVTGNTVRLGPLGELVWHLCEGEGTPREFARHLPGDAGWRGAALDVVRELAELGFLFPSTPASGTVRADRPALSAAP
ncbi:radical SAM protein [Streptomyces sp. DT2A-34]|uniref:B12-binding domain-containing radical SAM protein n=1 Tax=Streptomyces sp. DT2A-34 TaxID=3051182 RepID=UPI00265BB6F8|nr:radical SAM protein [Streptomyces sp. DT2A-34]MDO0915974.1 radical SAM protein [Streptomyces sp. DT2A-34]